MGINLAKFYVVVQPTRFKLSWELEETDPPLAPIGYNIYFSETSQNFTKVNADLVDNKTFLHIYPNYSKSIRAWYKIEAVMEDGTTQLTRALSFIPNLNEYQKTMGLRFLFWSMSFPAGSGSVPALVFPARKSGAKCKICSMPGQGSFLSKCKTCYGTGFDGGYYEPVLVFLSYNMAFQKSKSNTGDRISEEVPQSVELSTEWAIIGPNDYIMELEAPNRLWAAQNVSINEFNGYPISQRVGLMQEESGHPLYSLTLPHFTQPDKIVYKDFSRLNDEGKPWTVRDTYYEMAAQIPTWFQKEQLIK